MIELTEVEFEYEGKNPFRIALDDLTIARGELVAIVGPSGCGKSTLLQLIAGILKPTRGQIRIGDTTLSSLSDSQRRSFRMRRIGQVFQTFALLDYLTVLDNVLIPTYMHPDLAQTNHNAKHMLAQLGLEKQIHKYPETLSQGERQRVAVCRALLTQPQLILADEPTGNLDPANKQAVVDILVNAAKNHKATLVMVTHDESLLDRFSQVIPMEQLEK